MRFLYGRFEYEHLPKHKKEETKKITNIRELAESILKKGNDIEKMTDDDRAKMDAHALRVQRMAEAVEEQLKYDSAPTFNASA